MIKLLLKNGRWFLQSSPASLSSFSSLLSCHGNCHCHRHRLCIVIVIVIVPVIVFVMIVIVLLTATIPGGASRSRWSPARTWPTLLGILSADLLEGRYIANWPLFPLERKRKTGQGVPKNNTSRMLADHIIGQLGFVLGNPGQGCRAPPILQFF